MFQRFRGLAVAGLVPALGALLLTCAAAPARAAAVFDVTVLDATANAGGTGSFDVTIKNISGSEVDLGAFELELSVGSGSGVAFTDATTSTTDTYVFAGNSGAPPFVSSSTPLPGASVQVSDLYTHVPGYQPIAAGATYGLAHVLFSFAPGTSAGPVTVSIEPFDGSDGSGTLFLDGLGNILDFNSIAGTITVPEPSSLVLAGTALGLGIGLARSRREKTSRKGRKPGREE